MAAIWILLAKSLFPATLYQTYGGKAWITEIPFDITVDVIPQLMRDPDRFWQHLQVQSPQEIGGFERIVGDSPALRTAVGRAQRAAIHEVPVLILGESGTGKEMFADAIHKASGRRSKKMYSINCAAISRELIESELFGHVKGSFTGAAKDHVASSSRRTEAPYSWTRSASATRAPGQTTPSVATARQRWPVPTRLPPCGSHRRPHR